MIRKNILFVIDSLGFGGAERQLVELLKGLNTKKTYGIYLASLLKTESGYMELLEEEGIKIHFLERRKKYDLIRPIVRLKKYIHVYNIDLVHTFMNMGSLYGAVAAKLAGRPVVCSAIRDAKDSSLKEKYLKRFLSNIADRYVSNSKAGLQNRFANMKPHFRVIYNGIDFSRFERNVNVSELKKDLGIEQDQVVIGMVASLSEHKDHVTLFFAFKEILKSYPKARLLLVGDGPNRNYLEQLSHELQISDQVLFLGYRSDVDLIYPVMDIHVLLTNTDSHFEGISNAIIEAMATGVPVIATDCGGTPEIIKHEVNGLLVPPKDVEGTSTAITILLRDLLYAQEIASKARIRVHNMFGLERYIHDYEQLYKEILKEI